MGFGKWRLFKDSDESVTRMGTEEGAEIILTEKDFSDCKSYRLTLEGTTVEFKVPFPFEKIEDEEEVEWGPEDMERFADATFTKEDDYVMIHCYLHAPHIENYANAEEYVKFYLAECSEVKEKDRKIKQVIMQGNLFYYYIVPYKSEFGKFQELCVACDVGDGKIYAVETEWLNEKKKLTLDEVVCFMDFCQLEG